MYSQQIKNLNQYSLGKKTSSNLGIDETINFI